MAAVPAARTIEDLERPTDAVQRASQRYMMAETSCHLPEIIAARDG